MGKSLLRKASDLLHKVSGKYLNVDPSVKVKPGAFGIIDRHTGEFKYRGNIWDDEEVIKVIPDVMAYQPEKGELRGTESIKSMAALEWNFGADPHVTLPGLLEGSAKLTLKVTPGKRAAVLIMQDARTDYLPPDTLLPKLSKVEALKDMWVVTEVVVCSSYLLAVTHKGSQDTSGSVGAMLPVGFGPVSAGGKVSAGFSTNETYDFYSKGEPEKGGSSDPRYVTLFRLQILKRGWLYKAFGIFGPDRGPIPEDDPTLTENTCWMDAPVPWDILDEDSGEEDTPFDDPPPEDDDEDL